MITFKNFRYVFWGSVGSYLLCSFIGRRMLIPYAPWKMVFQVSGICTLFTFGFLYHFSRTMEKMDIRRVMRRLDGME